MNVINDSSYTKLPGCTDFECWFVECCRIGSSERIAPDEYMWDLKNPGHWLSKFEAGMHPRDAVMAYFRSQ